MKKSSRIKTITIILIIIVNILIITALIMSVNSNIKEISNKGLGKYNDSILLDEDNNMEMQNEIDREYNIKFIIAIKIILITVCIILIIVASVILIKFILKINIRPFYGRIFI